MPGVGVRARGGLVGFGANSAAGTAMLRGVSASAGPASTLRNAAGESATHASANYLNAVGSGFTDLSSD
jgi:hypothetical protein